MIFIYAYDASMELKCTLQKKGSLKHISICYISQEIYEVKATFKQLAWLILWIFNDLCFWHSMSSSANLTIMWFDICYIDASCKGYKIRHRRGKSETLRAQYINSKEVRSGGILFMQHVINLIILNEMLHKMFILQDSNWHLECCWKTSM